MKRLLFFIAFMSLGTVGLIFVISGEPESLSGPEPFHDELTNVLIMKGVAIRQMEDDRLRWELWAETATYHEDSDSAALEGVRFNVYDRKGAPGEGRLFHGQSKSAFVDAGPDRLVFQDDVRLFQGKDLEIRTERLEYDQKTQVINAPQRVWVRTPNGIHEGGSMRFSIRDQNLTFTQPTFYQ